LMATGCRPFNGRTPLANVTIIGGGMAGCELALQLAMRDIDVKLIEMRPDKMTDAHLTEGLAELVCSNSFRGDAVGNAVGLIKEEMRRAGGRLIALAEHAAVPAGGALAVDREKFSELVQAEVAAEPRITLERREWTTLEDPEADITVIATGPLTSGALAEAIIERSGEEQLYFYDSIAPIIDAESIDRDVVFAQSRYGKGDGDDYLNCPLDKEQYLAFIENVNAAEMAPVAAFEETKFFEACLPIEVMAERGVDTPRYGPMKPVGITDPRTGEQSYAIIQLRQENIEATAYNMVGFQSRMKWGEQKRIFRQIPGLEEAEFLRFGSVHRNTFVHGPKLLGPALEFAGSKTLRFAGQITGVEGYVESMATGLILGHLLAAELHGHEVRLPPGTTALGALRRHVTGELSVDIERFQPSNINWSMFPEMEVQRKMHKRKKRLHMSTRALADLELWLVGLAGLGMRRPGFQKRDPEVEMKALADQPPRRRRGKLPK
jgi:methylenetetrahydrofolate--tRNA-(uracil-5-)-methyltransferase